MALNLKERASQLSDRVAQASLVVRAREMYESLSPRDRRLFIMLVSFFALLLVGGGTLSARNYLKRRQQELERKQGQLTRVEEVRAEHEALKGQISKLEEELKRDSNFNLTAFLERTSTEVGFTEPVNIQSKGETVNNGFKEIAVEVRIRKASLDRLVSYLYLIENAPQRLTMKSLRIHTAFGNKSDLDAELEVSMLAPQET
jgi:general secretion pathway protein M